MSPQSSAVRSEKVSVWEDFLDIFYAPAQVYRRRENGNFWIPLLVVAVLLTVLAFANHNIIEPIFSTEFARSVPQMMKANPKLTPALIERSRTIGFAATQYGTILAIPILALLLAFVTWLLAKVFDAKLSWNAAMVVVSFGLIPRVVQQVALSVQGLLIDPANLMTRFSVELGPARFMDPATIQPLVGALLDHVELFTLWSVLLVTIGVAVIGKLSKAKAWGFGFVYWTVTLLPALYGAWKTM
ncbi:MAG: YIP1 family protein [Gemmatimonadaceae bacterium]